MVDPDIWGKHGWKFIHYVAQGYYDNPSLEQQNIYKHFFLNLGKILPCYKCSINYQNHLKINPLTEQILSNKNNLENWVVSIHNQVNKMKHKTYISNEQAKILQQPDDCVDYNKINVPPSKLNNDKQLHLNNINGLTLQTEMKYWIIIIILIALIIFLLIKKLR
ncbi:putative Erv-family thiol oxidoreductase [Cafeteria roenbergensis virus]|uniref:Sulfhydryl oxidase n=1 Tax=Cafeteria roenbergensis virus (strain BV-PW1) TaxID=693272 RepID=E3T5L5_CROVB|nr:putative Erv-family thiol oxidoreductase [Cafeteria roenbergensis virus BV-PW1]ADO67478.1 putative Erv-family thiol oxidoreductase [Cafeteria roenbergensis virus BV-PW1]